MLNKARMVSNQEFSEAYKNVEFKKVITSASKSFRRSLSNDEIKSCGMLALWRALRYYDAARAAKFTTFLYRITQQVCIYFVNQNRHQLSRLPNNLTVMDKGLQQVELLDSLSKLSLYEQQLIQYRFFDRFTVKEIALLTGWSQQYTRIRLREVKQRLYGCLVPHKL